MLDISQFVGGMWSISCLHTLRMITEIPHLSPNFNKSWAADGGIDNVAEIARVWCLENGPKGLKAEIVRLLDDQGNRRSPFLFIEVDGTASVDWTAGFYGHLDTQPETPAGGNWSPGLGPFTPVIRDGYLFGRGVSDDGYALFAAITGLCALQEQGKPYPRVVGLIEFSEESGSPDMPAYIAYLKERIGDLRFLICLDSGCGSYDRLSYTPMLRGVFNFELDVAVMSTAVHSGDASGIVPSSFLIACALLNRLVDFETGRMRPPQLFARPLPDLRVEEASDTAKNIGEAVYTRFPFLPGVQPMSDDPFELVMNRTLRPQLSITGISGLPPLASAGNLTLPECTIAGSIRVPPGADEAALSALCKEMVEACPPCDAKVTFKITASASGWDSPPLQPWLSKSINDASLAFYGQPAVAWAEGGTIPLMAMLEEQFPGVQMFVTGVLGPDSNAHGVDESLNLGMAERISSCLASVLTDAAVSL